MYRENKSYLQQSLFGVEQYLTKQQRIIWDKSKEHTFFESIFKNIDESRFSILYSKTKSRPNVPVNQLVGSLILKHLYDWTYEELYSHLSFNILTRHAIGIDDLQKSIFAPASLFNFQNKVTTHYLETGHDLFMEVFDMLTTDQINEFKVSTDIQRGDSFLMGSNIFDYTRITLIIEVLLRVYRILSETDKKQIAPIIAQYTKQTANQYSFKLKKENIPNELSTLGEIYHMLLAKLKQGYKNNDVFKMFERVYKEQFKLVAEEVVVVPSSELHSNILMSPDDDQATYRFKRNKVSKGFSGHISETANPDNKLNLITDLAVVPNNVDDAKILEERLPEMLEKTPDLNEYHVDAGYGNEQVDKTMNQHGIKQIQSNIKGKKSKAGIRIHTKENGEMFTKCNGGQEVLLVKTGKSWKAEFDFSICSQCPFKNDCYMKIRGGKRRKPKRYRFFYEKAILAHQRINNIDDLPPEKRKIRANVEATVKEAKRGMKNNKLRVRGLVKAKNYLVWTAIAINLTRINKYLIEKTTFLFKTMLIFMVVCLISKQVNVKAR